jgi:methylmalonyl-CoA epimerase
MELPLDHVAIAVPSIAESQPLFELLTGGSGSRRERLPDQSVEVVFVGSGPVILELLEPTDPVCAVARFLAKRGPGLHHLAYRVPDLDAALARLSAAGVELIDSTPRRGARGHRVAFLHPRSCGGVLLELVEVPRHS